MEETRGEADTRAAAIYASACNRSPGAVRFCEFPRTMQAWKPIFADNTTLILSTDSDLFRFLRNMGN
jgi:membrane protease subunit HflC